MQEAVGLYRDLGLDAHVAGTLTYLGHTYLDDGKFQSAADVLEESLTIWRARGMVWSNLGGTARSLLWLGRAVYLLGDAQRAMRLNAESLGIYREAGDRNGAGYDLGVIWAKPRSPWADQGAGDGFPPRGDPSIRTK